MNSRRNRTRPSARHDSSRERLPRILVVHDAKETEPQYLKGLRDACDNPRVEIQFADVSGKDPLKLIEEAVRRKTESLQRVKDERDTTLEYDQVWCVLDHDGRPEIPRAKQLAQQASIQLAISNPCFELWLLLHFRDPPGTTNANSLKAAIRKASPNGYSTQKHVDFACFQNGVDRAIGGAKKLDALALSLGEPDRNPTTGVYRLVEVIQND